ncbi:MAG TPA: hypothetical protein VNZ52_07705 [Candidatus Thermoplasmatota archaeon]|nr:hypothetical protein [Candidatus Thermoplasmatota archaeon]
MVEPPERRLEEWHCIKQAVLLSVTPGEAVIVVTVETSTGTHSFLAAEVKNPKSLAPGDSVSLLGLPGGVVSIAPAFKASGRGLV